MECRIPYNARWEAVRKSTHNCATCWATDWCATCLHVTPVVSFSQILPCTRLMCFAFLYLQQILIKKMCTRPDLFLDCCTIHQREAHVRKQGTCPRRWRKKFVLTSTEFIHWAKWLEDQSRRMRLLCPFWCEQCPVLVCRRLRQCYGTLLSERRQSYVVGSLSICDALQRT